MRYCKRCVLPDTKPGVVFDDEGVCSACRYIETKKNIDWDARQKQLQALCDSVRGTNGQGYDCLVPVSGGKDSMFQVYTMSQVHGLKTLAVAVVPHLQTVEGIENLNALCQNLGVDLIKVGVRPSTLRKMRRMALIKLGNPNYAEHHVVFSAVARTALFYNTPLVVWGEDIGAEFGGTVDEKASSEGSAENLINNDLFRESRFDDLIEGTLSENELFFYRHPAVEEFQRRNIRSIYLGHFYWWDGYKNLQVAKQFGFTERRAGPLSGNILAYDNIDEKLCEIHIWFKFLKLGFWRPTDQACYHIWNGRMSREDAVKLVREKQYQFPIEYLQDFLDYHELGRDQFFEIEDRWRNRDLWHQVNGQWRLIDEIH